jgi:mRNA interferase RelE/StbE
MMPLRCRLTIYRLAFGKRAQKQWDKLDHGIQQQFKKKLSRILENPHIPSAQLHGFRNSYRIKLRKAGYRLGYKVIDDRLLVLVVAVGRRDKDEVYADFALNYREGI